MKKILLVDDEPHVLKVLKHFLDKNGYAVTMVNNGLQALDEIASSQPDVVITDVQMPKMTGQELCEKVIEQYPGNGPHMIVMTSRTDQGLREWVKDKPNLEFLEKPLSPRMLVSRLREYFESTELAEAVSS